MNMMMINDHHDDEQDEHDEHTDDDAMHDMHTNTMHHAWCNVWYKGNTQRMNAQMHKNTKNKRNVTKTCKNIQKHEQTMAFKKTMATKRDEQKGSLKR